MLTPQQARAVDCRDVSVILSSGAGCGKTHVLTGRYLAQLRAGDVEVGQVVTITFTERAARQMRERIRLAVRAEIQAAPSDAMADRWARHLRDLESAPISTIHAFCANLLRQHAVQVGLDPRFDILEDVLAVNLEAEAQGDCLQQLLTASSPENRDLAELVLLYGWRLVLTGITALVRTPDTQAWADWLDRPAEAIAAGWQAFARERLLPRLVRHVIMTTPKIVGCLDLLRRCPPRPGTKMAANVDRLLQELPRLAEAPDLASAVAELVECAKVGGERAKAWPSEDAYEEVKTAFEQLRQALPAALGAFLEEAGDGALAAATGQRFVRVAAAVIEAYRQRKRRNGVVDFQDLLVLARNLLRDHADVRERLQRRFRVLLIDELQDTDPVQCELVEYLCGGGLTQGMLFAVGDHKQSIYRFRGADVSRFLELRQRVPHAGRLDLTRNFRSQPAILAFVNALLSRHLIDYEPLQAHLPQLNAGPCVEFLWASRDDKELATEARATEADAIARRVAAMVETEALVGDGAKLRPVKAKDVVLLFRAMSNVALYEAALRKYGLDYYLVGGRAFFAQQEIYDLLNMLRTLENPQDAVSLAGTLRSPFCCLSDEALFVLSRHADGLWAGLQDDALAERLPDDQREPVERARRFLSRWRSLKDRLPIARLLGEVFADSGYDAATQFEYLGDRKLANLWKLVDLARTFDRSGLFGLAEFIDRLGDLVQSQPREEQAATQPEKADVVRLMTIHQAKGLEFPVVIVPDLNARRGSPQYAPAHWDARLGCVARAPDDQDAPPFSPFGWKLWQAAEKIEDWHEELRTLYVACTRAQDYLILSASLKDSLQPDNAWVHTLAERFDLRTGACRVEGIAPDQAPRVRVVDDLTEFPKGRAQPRAKPPAETADATEWAERVAPVPLRLENKPVFTIAEIENVLMSRANVTDWAFQFAAEDGSDRTAWMTPRDRLQPCVEADELLDERILRAVLERWDWRDPAGWRAALEQVNAEGMCEKALTQLTTSATFRALAEAKTCYRSWEFARTVELADATPPRRLLIRGLIDCLWEDAEGHWHLLAYTTKRLRSEERAAYGQVREIGLALAAAAVQLSLGAWPKSATLYWMATGAADRWSGRRLQAPAIQARLQAVLKDFLGRCLAAD
jgi:ATP-dependent helicase/nuclease subunit A